MNKAILILPESGNNADLTTNGVHLVTIIEHLHNLQQGLSEQLVKEAERMVGKDRKRVEAYLQNRCDEAHRQQGKSEGGFSSKDILN